MEQFFIYLKILFEVSYLDTTIMKKQWKLSVLLHITNHCKLT